MTGPVVIGVGNPWRGDDGVGIAVVRAVAAALGPGDGPVEVRELDGEPARLLEVWRDRPLAVVVDAVRTGAPPGTVLPAVPDVHGPAAGGSHALGLADALRLGGALGRLPDRLEVVGVEGARFDPGDELDLSAPVAAAVPEARDLVLAALRSGWSDRRAGGSRCA